VKEIFSVHCFGVGRCWIWSNELIAMVCKHKSHLDINNRHITLLRPPLM